MYDKEVSFEILRRIYGSIEIIIKRFKPIISPDDFTYSDAGLEKLDAIKRRRGNN